MTEIDMTFETREELIRRDFLEEGIEIGRKEGEKQAVLSMIRKGYLNETQGAETLGISEEELRKEMACTD